MISALQVRVLPQPHIRAGSRQSHGSKPPNWVVATTSTMIPTVRSADTAYGIIMYNSCLDEFEEGTNNGNADNRLTLGDTRIYGSNGAGNIGGSSPGTLSLAEVSARSGGPTRHPSKAPSRTALQASRYGSGDGGRRGKRTRPTNSSGSDGSRGTIVADDSSTSRSNSPKLRQIHSLRQNVMRHLRQQELSGAYQSLEEIIVLAREAKRNGDRDKASAIIDETIKSVAETAFAKVGGRKEAANRIAVGLDALHLQLSTQSDLIPPYNAIPRATWIKALRALTSARGVQRLHLKGGDSIRVDGTVSVTTPADAAFGVLQRLITGAGVRRSTPSGDDGDSASNNLDERDFSMVLNAFVSSGRMDMAHRVVALQERTKSAPPLSPVAYSIMIKGYGKLQDAKNIEMMLSHARKNSITPDTIMYNSLIDAYVNCDLVEEAQKAFLAITDRTGSNMPTPNARSYNTMLKGYARKGDLRKALELSQSMDSAGLWNEVTTNTLVKAAVVAGEFEAAENILAKFTTVPGEGQGVSSRKSDRRGVGGKSRHQQHPNIEAYTDLIDGYGKAKMLDKATGTFRNMRQRGVEPNEYSYTCLISAMARNGKMDEANALLSAMESADVRPTTVTYNAFIAAALADAPPRGSAGSADVPDSSYLDEEHRQYNNRIVDCLKLLGRMVKSKVRPNEITISTIVGGMGRCYPPRIEEAKSIVAKLDRDGTISRGDERIGTALIHTCGDNGDFDGSLEAYNAINKPDIIALNAFLDACCKCGKVRTALETFEAMFTSKSESRSRGSRSTSSGRSRSFSPDVVSYTTLISALLEMGSSPASDRAHKLYDEMKSSWGISPDIALVDIILSAMVGGGSLGLDAKDMEFIRKILRDAEGLQGWAPNQLEDRIKEVRFLLLGRLSEAWKTNESAFGIDDRATSTEKVIPRDPLFEKKGWNTVDSGFRLWGGGFGGTPSSEGEEDSTETVDSFLREHGWNEIGVGFKLF